MIVQFVRGCGKVLEGRGSFGESVVVGVPA